MRIAGIFVLAVIVAACRTPVVRQAPETVAVTRLFGPVVGPEIIGGRADTSDAALLLAGGLDLVRVDLTARAGRTDASGAGPGRVLLGPRTTLERCFVDDQGTAHAGAGESRRQPGRPSHTSGAAVRHLRGGRPSRLPGGDLRGAAAGAAGRVGRRHVARAVERHHHACVRSARARIGRGPQHARVRSHRARASEPAGFPTKLPCFC